MCRDSSMLSDTHRSCNVGVKSVEERDERLHVHSTVSSCCRYLRN